MHLQKAAFEAQHLSLIAWALAVLECKPVRPRPPSSIPHPTPARFAQYPLAWCVARWQVRLLEQMEQLTLKQLQSFNTQNCANLLWGFATLNYTPSALLPKMSEKLADPLFLAKIKPVEVADSAFAIAAVGSAEAQAPLMRALASRAEPQTLLSNFSSRQLVTLTWSFARLGLEPTQLTLWIEEIQSAHAQQPLLAQDQQRIEEALDHFGLSKEWLSPPKEVDEEDGA